MLFRILEWVMHRAHSKPFRLILERLREPRVRFAVLGVACLILFFFFWVIVLIGTWIRGLVCSKRVRLNGCKSAFCV